MKSDNMISIDCVVCGNKKYTHWGKHSDINIVKCAECNFVWANPRPTDNVISDFYSNYPSFRGNNDNKELGDKRQIQYIADRDLIYNMFIGENNIKVLDFGCHDGLFLDTFDKRFDKHGVEIGADAVDWAKKNLDFGANVHACDIVDAPYENDTFDLIIMRGVIEHLTYPDICMQRVSDLLRPGGLLYILATPNIGGFIGRTFGSRWKHVNPPEHLLFFSDYTLERYLKKFDFEMILKQFPYEKTPYENVGSDVARIRGLLENDSDEEIDIPFYNSMMSAVFYKSSWNKG